MCLDHAGHHEGDGYAVQANMMATDRVWPAMAEAYESASGALAERLLAALRAAQREGGDARGQMSAAMAVVDGERRDEAWAGVTLDVRVEQHDAPLDELARLLDLATDYGAIDGAEEALTEGRADEALGLLAPVLARLPREGNALLVQAGALAATGQPDAAVEVLRTLLAAQPTWAVVLRSFVAKGMVSLPPGVDIDALAPG
jgi:predicted Zn-dependent protease